MNERFYVTAAMALLLAAAFQHGFDAVPVPPSSEPVISVDVAVGPRQMSEGLRSSGLLRSLPPTGSLPPAQIQDDPLALPSEGGQDAVDESTVQCLC